MCSPCARKSRLCTRVDWDRGIYDVAPSGFWWYGQIKFEWNVEWFHRCYFGWFCKPNKGRASKCFCEGSQVSGFVLTSVEKGIWWVKGADWLLGSVFVCVQIVSESSILRTAIRTLINMESNLAQATHSVNGTHRLRALRQWLVLDQ